MKQGFSLIELMLVIALISILSVFSVIGAQNLLYTRSHDNALSRLNNTLQTAQSNSRASGITTVICPTMDAQSCNNSPDWSIGWLAYNDLNESHSLDGGEKIILVQSIDNENLKIQLNAAGNGAKAIFYRSGRLWPNGNFVICHSKINKKYKVIITSSGRIRTVNNDLLECN